MIALLTDFGLEDTYVGVLKGVIQGIAPGTQVADLSHAVPRGDIRRGAYLLRQASPYFPSGTIFLAVVDPGVGSARRPMAVQTERAFYVGPDNGLFTFVGLADPIRQAVQLANPAYRLPTTSTTFHGRDIFAPAAAHLSRGVQLSEFGPPIMDPVQLSLPRLEVRPEGVYGEVLHVDHFGNVTTSIGHLSWLEESCRLEPWLPRGANAGLEFAADHASVRLGGQAPLPLKRTFADVPAGEALALINSEGQLEIAVNRGSAAERYEAVPGTSVVLDWVSPT